MRRLGEKPAEVRIEATVQDPPRETMLDATIDRFESESEPKAVAPVPIPKEGAKKISSLDSWGLKSAENNISNGAILDLKKEAAQKLLKDAVTSGYVNLVKALIACGADPNAKADNILFTAKDAATVQVLLAAGADPNQKNALGGNMFFAAEDAATVQVLLAAGADLKQLNIFGRNALHYAANAKVAQALIAAGVDLNQQDSSGATPLSTAIKSGNSTIALALIASDANLELPDKEGKTPAVFALEKRNYALVDALLAKGAKLKFKDPNDAQTYLLGVAQQKIPGLIKALVNAGADPNYQDYMGKTALHYATNAEAVQELIASGAKTDARDKDNKTPFDLAFEKRNNELFFALLAGGTKLASGGEYLVQAAQQETPGLIKALLTAGADPNDKDNTGATALHYTRSAEDAQGLINSGAAINLPDQQGRTPFDFAIARGSADVANLLLDKGVSPWNVQSLQQLMSLPRGMPFLESLKKETLERILSAAQDENGNTLVHDRAIYQQLKGLLRKRNIDTRAWINKQYLDPSGFLDIMDLSPGWLATPKRQTADATPLTRVEYDKQAQTLETDLKSLWDKALAEIPADKLPLLLQADSKDNSPDTIWAAINKILAKVQSQEPWLGTPRADQPERLHNFYNGLLQDLNAIVQKLQDRPAVEVLGNLVSTALPELEGRCAAAYEQEFKQQAGFLTGDAETLSADGQVKAAAAMALQSMVEKLSNTRDVHKYADYAYSVGLQPYPDALSTLPPEVCRANLMREFNPVSFAKDFGDHLSLETATDWLKEQTPAEVLPDYAQLRNEIKTGEEALAQGIKDQLAENKIPDPSFGLVTDRGMRAANLGASVTNSASVNDLALGVLPKAWPEELQKSVAAVFLSNKDPATLLEEVGEVVKKFREQLTQGGKAAEATQLRMSWGRAQTSVLESLAAVRNFDEQANKLGLKPEQRVEVLQLQKKYEDTMQSYVPVAAAQLKLENVDVGYSTSANGSVSNAIENARRMKYNEKAFEKESAEAVMSAVLRKMGVFA